MRFQIIHGFASYVVAIRTEHASIRPPVDANVEFVFVSPQALATWRKEYFPGAGGLYPRQQDSVARLVGR